MSSPWKKKPVENDEDDDDDEDDEDYIPNGGGAGGDEESEEDEEDHSSGEEEEADENEDGQIGKRKSEKAGLGEENVGSSKAKKKADADAPESEQKREEEKKKTEDLWSSFLKDVGGKTSTSGIENTTTSNKTSNEEANQQPTKTADSVEVKKVGSNTSIKSLFGESKPIETIKPSVDSVPPKPSLVKAPTLEKKVSSGGLASILGQMGKQPKLSTLEKSKLDWDEFKKSENLEDELNKYSKGKDSYLDRQRFLERTDMRQFELERELREKQRKLRESKN